MPTQPPAPSAPTTATRAARYLTFTLGRESYGFPVLKVREIIRLCPITLVPRMPAFFRGVINLRGKVIPILDLRARFQLPDGADTERTCIIVVQPGDPSAVGIQMGAIVDTVEEVIQLAEGDIGPAPDFGGTPDTRYIAGMATVRGTVKTLLHLEQIFLETGTLSLPSDRTSNPTAQHS